MQAVAVGAGGHVGEHDAGGAAAAAPFADEVLVVRHRLALPVASSAQGLDLGPAKDEVGHR